MWWWVHPHLLPPITISGSVHGDGWAGGVPALGREFTAQCHTGAAIASLVVVSEQWITGTARGDGAAVTPNVEVVTGIGVKATVHGGGGGSMFVSAGREFVSAAHGDGSPSSPVFARGFGVEGHCDGGGGGAAEVHRGVRTVAGIAHGAAVGHAPVGVYGVFFEATAMGGGVSAAGLSAGKVIAIGSAHGVGVVLASPSCGVSIEATALGGGVSASPEILCGIAAQGAAHGGGAIPALVMQRGIGVVSPVQGAGLSVLAAQRGTVLATGLIAASVGTSSGIVVSGASVEATASGTGGMGTVEVVRGAYVESVGHVVGLASFSASLIPAAGTATMQLGGEVLLGAVVLGQCTSQAVIGGLASSGACVLGTVEVL